MSSTSSSDDQLVVKVAKQSLAIIEIAISRGSFTRKELPDVLRFAEDLETIMKSKPTLTFGN
jgi:hypothetical protein